MSKTAIGSVRERGITGWHAWLTSTLWVV